MSESINRRKLLGALTLSIMAGASTAAPNFLGDGAEGKVDPTKNKEMGEGTGEPYYFCSTVQQMKQLQKIRVGFWVETAGFFQVGDGGGGRYLIAEQLPEEMKKALGTDSPAFQALSEGKWAVLIPSDAVHYRMMGALGDGKNNDGVQIQHAHRYAHFFQIPIKSEQGEWWLKDTYNIEIRTSVQWGRTIFHMEELNNTTVTRWLVPHPEKPKPVLFSEEQKASFLRQFKPGVKIIPELEAYKQHLLVMIDQEDKIGLRSGKKFEGQAMNRTEVFYVEEGGKILGDIAWVFKNFTSLMAIPDPGSYLIIDGGTFLFNGKQAKLDHKKYVKNGFNINRSRTIVRNQYAALEPGATDQGYNPRSGFYSIQDAYDVTLENIRLIPWVQDRPGTDQDVPAGTYGISTNRTLRTTYKNITAEGNHSHWGVFGTNMNKDFRIEGCQLNRIDVHFHCYNLHISNTQVGVKGINITGGGQLTIENTTCNANRFINFRKDFGAKWDGHVRIRNCRYIPSTDGETSLLYHVADDFDYRYPIGFAQSIDIDGMVVDYRNHPQSKGICWVLWGSLFSKTKFGERLIFPQQFLVRNILVEGREQGLRLFHIGNPIHYSVQRKGALSEAMLTWNSRILVDHVQLEEIQLERSDKKNAHLIINPPVEVEARDESSLLPRIEIRNCNHLEMEWNGNAVDILLEDCTVRRLTGSSSSPSNPNQPQGLFPGSIFLNRCKIQGKLSNDANTQPLQIWGSLGSHFQHCTFLAPTLNQQPAPEKFDRYGLLQWNKKVMGSHVHSSLGRDMLNYWKKNNMMLKPDFIAKLLSHHELED